MLEQMAQEQAEAELQAQKEAEARAERAAVMTSEHTLLIKEQIQSQWRYPPAVDSGMEGGAESSLWYQPENWFRYRL